MTDVREAIWVALLNSARWERYYGVLASRRERMERIVRFVLIASAIGAVAAAIDQLHAAFGLAFGAGVGLAAAVDATVRRGRDAVVYMVIRDECHRCKIELESLWRESHQLNRPEAEQRLGALKRALHAATSRIRDRTTTRPTRRPPPLYSPKSRPAMSREPSAGGPPVPPGMQMPPPPPPPRPEPPRPRPGPPTGSDAD